MTELTAHIIGDAIVIVILIVVAFAVLRKIRGIKGARKT